MHRDMNQLETLQLTCELLAAAVTLREGARERPVDKAECLRVALWMRNHARASINVPTLAITAQRGTISADGIATDAQQIAAKLLGCRDELRKDACDVPQVFATLADVTLGIDQLHANIAAGVHGRAA
jgi:hypothetical protein